MTNAVLQISDCHLVVPGGSLIGVDTQASLEAVLAQACAEATPEAIIASGDLAHDPSRDVYLRFVETVRRYSSAPLLCLPGNHDVLEVMQAARLPMQTLELGRWSIVWLDSHEDELPVSLVSEQDRQQTGKALQLALGQHALVATHHPLISVNSPWLDKDRIQSAVELIEYLAECSVIGSDVRLRSVVFGHAHQDVEGHCAKVPVYGAPSTCFQFKPGSEKFAIDTLSPGYRWLYLADDGGVTTQIRRVESFSIHVQLDA